MSDYWQGHEHGQVQALANVDAILLDEMRRSATNGDRHRLLVALRRRIKSLEPPATELRAVGEYPELPLDDVCGHPKGGIRIGDVKMCSYD